MTVKKKVAMPQWEINNYKNRTDLENKSESATSVGSHSNLEWIKNIVSIKKFNRSTKILSLNSPRQDINHTKTH